MSQLILIVLVALSAYCAAALVPFSPSATQLQKSPIGKVVNGNLAAANQFPWQTSIQAAVINGTSLTRCGGAIISSNRVLTAAHCTRDFHTFRVGFGSNTIGTPLISQTVDRINVVEHPSFNIVNLNYDISIIRLNADLTFVTSIQPIRLPRRVQSVQDYFSGQQGQIAGWGRINDANTTLAETLRYTSISLFTFDICKAYYGASVVTTSTLCGVGIPDSRSSPCGGDSGGPLAWRDPADTIWTIIGVFSFISETGCASASPSGYTNVASYLDWISVNTGIIIRN